MKKNTLIILQTSILLLINCLLSATNVYNTLTLVNKEINGKSEVKGIETLDTGPNDTICKGDTAQLSASGGTIYSWTPANTLNDSTIADPKAFPIQTTTYKVAIQGIGNNLIINGDFSQGNVGFTSSYIDSNYLWAEGTYYVGTNPNLYHPNFAACADHTTGTGNMMIVNGASTANVIIWQETNITVVQNTNYIFSCWLTSVTPSNPAQLQFFVNGVQIGNVFTASATICQWNNFYNIWNSGANTNVTISIINQNISPSGNDFALDDIYFAEVISVVDSTIVIVNPVYNLNVDKTICEGQIYQVGAHTYTTTGTYVDNLISSLGCDSNITTNLTVNPAMSITVNKTICEGQTYQVGAHTYSTTGIYTDTLTTSLGCDSIITTNLTVNPTYNLTVYDSICQGQTYQVGSSIYTTSGVYVDNLTTFLGCDSIITTHLLVIPLLPIINTGDTTLCTGILLSVSIPSGSYNVLWNDGNTNYFHSFNQAGMYNVTVWNSCFSTTKIFNLSYQDCDCFLYYPNAFTPNGDGLNDTFCAFYKCEFTTYKLYIYNRMGQLIFETSDPSVCWDGKYMSKDVDMGVYVWMVQYTGPYVMGLQGQHGTVTVIR